MKKTTNERYLDVIEYVYFITKSAPARIKIGDIARMNGVSNSISKAMQDLGIIEKVSNATYKWKSEKPTPEMAVIVKEKVNENTKRHIFGQPTLFLSDPDPHCKEDEKKIEKKPVPDDLREILHNMSEAARMMAETHEMISKKIYEIYSV